MCLRFQFCTYQRVCMLYFLKKVKFVVPYCAYHLWTIFAGSPQMLACFLHTGVGEEGEMGGGIFIKEWLSRNALPNPFGGLNIQLGREVESSLWSPVTCRHWQARVLYFLTLQFCILIHFSRKI
jgi:hypothetical protein